MDYTPTKDLTMICNKCGLEIRPANWFFITEEEMIEQLKHICLKLL